MLGRFFYFVLVCACACVRSWMCAPLCLSACMDVCVCVCAHMERFGVAWLRAWKLLSRSFMVRGASVGGAPRRSLGRAFQPGRVCLHVVLQPPLAHGGGEDRAEQHGLTGEGGGTSHPPFIMHHKHGKGEMPFDRRRMSLTEHSFLCDGCPSEQSPSSTTTQRDIVIRH